MANIDLKNLNLEDIKNQILKFADKKTLIKIGIGVGGLLLFLIIYYAIINPIVNKKKAQLDDMNKKKDQIQKNLKDILEEILKTFNLKQRIVEYLHAKKIKDKYLIDDIPIFEYI